LRDCSSPFAWNCIDLNYISKGVVLPPVLSNHRLAWRLAVMVFWTLASLMPLLMNSFFAVAKKGKINEPKVHLNECLENLNH
jgi:hypothetical protein